MRRISGLLAATLLVGVLGSTTAHASDQAGDQAGALGEAEGTVLLLLDSSGSMAEPAAGGISKIEAARTSLSAVVDAVPESAEVGLRVFGATVADRGEPGACTDTQLVVPPGTDNRDALRTAVDSYEPYGETPISQGLRAAAGDLGTDGPRTIVLVSDGEATCAPDPCEVAAEVRDRGIDLRVDVVGLDVDARARDQLRCVAERGGGTYYDADSAEQLTRSLVEASTRAARPYAEEGTPVDGSDDPFAPTELTPGRWLDTLGPERADDGNRYYRVRRTVPGSTIHVSASFRGRLESYEGLRLDVATEDGQSCETDSSSKGHVDTAVAGASVVAPTEGYSAEECAAAPALLVEVERDDSDATEDAPMVVTVVEESPVAGTTGLPLPGEPEPYSAPQVGGATDLEGGTSFASAPEVTTGSYRGTMVPGETQVWAVRLDWGQSVRLRAALPAATDAIEEQVGGWSSPAGLSVYDPLRTRLDGYREGGEAAGFLVRDEPSSLRVMTEPVRYLNRDEWDGGSHLPGLHYVSLASEPEDPGVRYEQPFTLEVEVVEAAADEAAAPAYTHPEIAPTVDDLFGAAGETVPPAEPVEPSEPSEPSEPLEPTETTDPTEIVEPEPSRPTEVTDDETRLAADSDDGLLSTRMALGGTGAAILLALVVALLVVRPGALLLSLGRGRRSRHPVGPVPPHRPDHPSWE